VALDPVERFREWFDEARAAGAEMPEAMTLATADAEGRPSARMVLLKGVDERGFSFFTGYESRKGRELAENPRAALVFYWRELGRQVRVEGPVTRLPADESDAYWETRPPRSRAAAAASRQSEPIESRARLEDEFERQLGGNLARPERWGGYVLAPETIELWQHRDDRLHERLRFTRAREGGWREELLQP
jgi:pyridoxamine 5'-phosphate oxidase